MANANQVSRQVSRLVRDKKSMRIEVDTIGELKRQIGAGGMSTPCLRQVLAGLKHQNVLRGFSLRGDKVYIQG